MRKQFDLNYYLEHPDVNVVTRDGHSVRIICTDVMSEDNYEVVGLISYEGSETVHTFSKNGLVLKGCEDQYDLFFDLPDPEKKRVPLTYVDLWERVKANKTMWVTDNNGEMFQIVEFGDSGWYEAGFDHEYKMSSLMEQQMHFADGTPCWKEVEE